MSLQPTSQSRGLWKSGDPWNLDQVHLTASPVGRSTHPVVIYPVMNA